MAWLLLIYMERCRCLFIGISGVSSFHPIPLRTVKSQKNGVKNGVRFWDVCQIIKGINSAGFLKLPGNLFFSPASHRKGKEPVNPFTGWHLQSKWGFTGRTLGSRAQSMEKGVFQCTSIEISLSYKKSILPAIPIGKVESCPLPNTVWAACIKIEQGMHKPGQSCIP